ncbi:MAG: cytochrome ubiquinol oxidase subunit I [candidate division Zixibacteria bacterium]
MQYAIWEPFLANSILIAVVAILHVFVAHFAIGGGLYLVLAEIWARRKNDDAHLGYVKKHSKFFALTTLVFGAVSGVGIWVTIGLIHPNGTKWLINNFVWGWATEWIFFFIEITAAMIYYYGWKRLSAKTHIAVGWIYFIAAWLSLVIINGILTFMLTPGEWLTTGNFWDGFFNPAYFAATLFRTCICLMLAGLYATVSVAKEKNRDLKVKIMRRNGWFIIIPLLVSIPFGLWYYNVLPQSVTGAFLPGMVPTIALQVMIFSAGLLLLLSVLSTLVFPRHTGYVSASILMLLGLMAMGGFEWSREAARKPYIIYDFLYSNNVLKSEEANLPSEKPLPVKYPTGNRGRDLYLAGCRSCHTLDGYNSLGEQLAGVETEHIANIIPRLQHFIGKMPPFPGNEKDAADLAEFLASHTFSDPVSTRMDLTEAEKNQIVFDRRCGGCHTLNGYREIGSTFADLDYEESEELVLMVQDLTDEMPPFAGDENELKMLIAHLRGGAQ